MDALSRSLKKLWNEWELQTMVLLSLTLQILLILLGNRRKYINKIWITIVVWPAYLLADFIATSALGLLTNRFVYHSGPLDAKLQLTALWAPFLLLHLGGPDTITAYSMEDNQLWSRHLLELAAQTGFAFYILFAGWTGSRLSFLTIPMMLAGLIKYGERTWVLYSASYERRKALISSHHIKLQSYSDVQANSNISDAKLLQVAYGMFNIMAKHLFAGVAIAATEPSSLANQQEMTFNLLEKIGPEDAFKVIEVQLGFMYDILYTKALVTYTPYGIGLRFLSFLLTSFVLVSFSLAPQNTHKYSNVDLCITFLLLAVAIVLELYAALSLLLSDRTLVWLRKRNLVNILPAIASLPLLRNPRWSNSMGQYDIVIYFRNEKPMDFRRILSLLKLNPELEKQRYAAYCQVPKDLKKWLVMHSKKFRGVLQDLKGSTIDRFVRAVIILEDLNYDDDTVWFLSSVIEFRQTIIVWHIATEICYHLDHGYFPKGKKEIRRAMDENDNVVLNWKMSKHVSRYMMYLLAISPETLPASGTMGQINFKLTCEEGRKAMESFKPQADDQVGTPKERKSKIKIEASKWLFDGQKDSITEERNEMEKKLNGSLLSLGCALAKRLVKKQEEDEEPQSMDTKWEVIARFWFEILLHAGQKCRRNQHAQQLRQGGEFLTHFWLFYEEFAYLDELSTTNSSSDV
ncbi:unnamed protein product [Dovyalis caffra]|uniref:DUF4220 domain-containing protein n=1 Tax=Dovyalis caffra TaxID=77055 RepID=A0AAV1QT41_9ROSI|nr:unnamed protein product [Dovyalis caffra]